MACAIEWCLAWVHLGWMSSTRFARSRTAPTPPCTSTAWRASLLHPSIVHRLKRVPEDRADPFRGQYLTPNCIIKDRKLFLVELLQLLESKQAGQAHGETPDICIARRLGQQGILRFSV